MAAAVYRRPGHLEIEEVPVPQPGEGEVLVEVSHCGICGTDLHNVLDGWAMPDSIGGHEWSGTEVATGRRVVGGAAPGCGECEPCRTGRANLCRSRRSPGVDPFQGAFARYVAVSSDAVEPVPEGVPLREAAYAEPLAIGLHAITVAGAGPGDPGRAGARVLVVGAGPIGASIVAALASRSLTDVTAVEPVASRRDLVGGLGARTLDPADLVLPALPGDVAAEPYDVVFECSGVREAMEMALGQVDRAGTLVLVGTGLDPPRLDTNRVLLNEVNVTGAFGYDEGGFAEALALIGGGSIAVDRLIEPTDVALDGMLEAMGALRAGEIAGKVLVRP
jgi:(R,R)-butanediol dehydrogenase/meso-butanediol dehydrogenase/diacetyl reductase